uniref:Putative secreted salivary gland peptide n=1 Tax=Ixodes scapularis TaxID=6945 RepID=Q5Q9A0_IXOSC|nr:putative secreted salivary gland peptide [Ixodes scapularis]
MQLVVLAVVFILPSFLSGETFSRITEAHDECGVYIEEGGARECYALGTTYKIFSAIACAVLCENGEQRQFPEGVCSGGKVNCTSEAQKRLEDWLSMIQTEFKHF